MGAQLSPAVSLSSSALDDGLDEDTQLLQACVGTDTHPDDADPEAVVIWKHTDHIRVTTAILHYWSNNVHHSSSES